MPAPPMETISAAFDELPLMYSPNKTIMDIRTQNQWKGLKESARKCLETRDYSKGPAGTETGNQRRGSLRGYSRQE